MKEVITVSNIKSVSLKKKFKNFKGKNPCKNFSWGKDVGLEVIKAKEVK